MARASISKAWEETTAIVRRDGALLIPVALAFIVMPSLLTDSFFRPAVTDAAAGWSGAAMNPIALLGTLYASLVISVMALRPAVSVAEALAQGFRRLPVAIGASLLTGLAVAFLILPVVPLAMGGAAAAQRVNPLLALALSLYLIAAAIALIYVMVRLTLLNTVAANDRLGVIATVRRSWALSRGMFWRLLGFILLFLSLSAVTMLAVVTAGGTVSIALGLITGPGVARLLTDIVGDVVNAAFLSWLYLMFASLYRQAGGLSGSSSGI